MRHRSAGPRRRGPIRPRSTSCWTMLRSSCGKVTLAQIVNLDGKYQEAVDLITGSQQPVVKLVAVADPKKRPKTGIASAAFASLAHQQLLRAYIGLQQVDPAV